MKTEVGIMYKQLSIEAQKNFSQWMESDDVEDLDKDEAVRVLNETPSLVEDAFYKKLEFGTGGLRGVVGFGTNRLNDYTILVVTRGLSHYLLGQFANKSIKVVIGYDSRSHSFNFASKAAEVLCASGINVFLFDTLHPTPLVSYACRACDAQAAIVITASHNPPQYNGYKVYWGDGGQVLAPHDQGIIDKIQDNIPLMQPKKLGKLSFLGEKLDQAYYKELANQAFCKDLNTSDGDKLKIVYSPLHGAGSPIVENSLEYWGFSNVQVVPEQKDPDGDFPTVAFPNPEEKEALSLGTKLMLDSNSDLFFATDPDADRVGVVISRKGEAIALTGNQIACICLEHICSHLKKDEDSTPLAFVKTIVTSELFKDIVESWGHKNFDVLTGFKYIAQKIEQWDQDKKYKFIFGAEESYGYLIGDFVRDKDAVGACCLISEVALQAKLQGKTLYDLLLDIYKKYGVYREKLVTISFQDGKAGNEKRKSVMESLRTSPLESIAGEQVVYMEDYLKGESLELVNSKTIPLELPTSDVIRYWLKDHSKITVRPSGTEPKIKIYCEARVDKDISSCDGITVCDQKIDLLVGYLQKRFS
jgi:phosphomannomutase